MSEVGADAPNREFESSWTPTASLDVSLARLDDTAALRAKDAKVLRDATSAAITQGLSAVDVSMLLAWSLSVQYRLNNPRFDKGSQPAADDNANNPGSPSRS
ncbi:hypothetical protein OSTOST_03480 [Ostertagia ostertagi]